MARKLEGFKVVRSVDVDAVKGLQGIASGGSSGGAICGSRRKAETALLICTCTVALFAMEGSYLDSFIALHTIQYNAVAFASKQGTP